MRPFASLAIALTFAGVLAPQAALAWGPMGHRLVGEAAIRGLPAGAPGFLRSPGTASEVGELSREADRSKGAGRIHDHNRDAAHFVDLDDVGRVLGGPRLAELPPTRAEYETALRAAGADSWKAGYLPYAIIDAWQQLTKDFGYWRALAAAESRSTEPGRRAWYAEDRRRREALILANIGVLSHYVADGAQPLHVTVHYNGWGDYPNPRGFTQEKIHASFEGDGLVRASGFATATSAPEAFRPCRCSMEARTAAYLGASGALVERVYELHSRGGLSGSNAEAAGFVRGRLEAGSLELRDLIMEAYLASETARVGWPAVTVQSVEAGEVDPFAALYGDE